MDQIIVALVDLVVVPLTAPIPFLVSSGILLAFFAALWIVFAYALVRDRNRLDAAWTGLRGRPLVLQAIAWLLLLPVLAGLWVWRTSWPAAARVLLIGCVAGWNLLVFMPAGG